MIRSMTGYGSFRAVNSGREIFVEIKSVNHKFFECFVHTSRAYGFLEDRVRKFAGGFIARGKLDININIVSEGSDETIVTANKAVLDGYLDSLFDYAVNSDKNIDTHIDYELLLKIPDGFTVQKAKTDEEELWSDVKEVLLNALDSFTSMRITEGDKLKDDIEGRLSAISDAVDIIDLLSPKSVEKYRQKLFDRMNEIIGSADEQRILTEAAIFAEKTAVFEETVRLKSHISQFEDFLMYKEPIGRKMDFLTQEMNREANTIGSKASDLEITRLVLNIKSDIEKIREQVQNIE
ncbi:MAG: YicC family protein [Ruminococcus sp.]|nr:YicC family protein [Ruminococcus sp.]